MVQQPRVTLRISGELYRELVAIAEAREVTLQQALDFWIERQKRQAIEEARQGELKGMPKRKPKRKAKRKPNPEPDLRIEANLPEPAKTIVKEAWPWRFDKTERIGRRWQCGKCKAWFWEDEKSEHKASCPERGTG